VNDNQLADGTPGIPFDALAASTCRQVLHGGFAAIQDDTQEEFHLWEFNWKVTARM
jgi:hypothetical protein